jgi:hypothetical protein
MAGYGLRSKIWTTASPQSNQLSYLTLSPLFPRNMPNPAASPNFVVAAMSLRTTAGHREMAATAIPHADVRP